MPITPSEALTRCIEHREIFHEEMLHLMRLLMRGEMSPQIASALIMGLRVKKETIGELSAAAQVMREFALHVQTPCPDELLDMAGTGGDGSHTFNISTCAMFVAAAAGLSPPSMPPAPLMNPRCWPRACRVWMPCSPRASPRSRSNPGMA